MYGLDFLKEPLYAQTQIKGLIDVEIAESGKKMLRVKLLATFQSAMH